MERKVVVVAPTFNEAENIAAFIEAVSKYPVKILVSDSHSTDGTAKIVRKYKDVCYLDVRKRGLGLGLSEGTNYAFSQLKADVVITMEADLSNDISMLPEFIKLANKYDFVIGSRYAAGGGIKNWSWWRRLLSLCANNVLRVLSGALNIHEFTNLYRAFNKKVWEDIKDRVSIHTDWLFVPAFAFEALSGKYKVIELPYTFFDRFGGRSKMNTVSYTKNLLKYAVVFRLQKSASFFKFLVVGGLGFVINTIVLIVGVNMGMIPANAGVLGAEIAIISNFILNNFWTFHDRKLKLDLITPLRRLGLESLLSSWSEVFQVLYFIFKFIQFNVLSFGSALIQFLFLKAGEIIFGLTRYKAPILDISFVKIVSWYMIFYICGVSVGLVWNYLMYSRIIWKKK